MKFNFNEIFLQLSSIPHSTSRVPGAAQELVRAVLRMHAVRQEDGSQVSAHVLLTQRGRCNQQMIMR